MGVDVVEQRILAEGGAEEGAPLAMNAGVEGQLDGDMPLDGVEADGLGMQRGEREGPHAGGGGDGEGELRLGVNSFSGLAVFFFLRGLRDLCGVVTHCRGTARLEGRGGWFAEVGRRDRLLRRNREEAQVRLGFCV